MPDEHWERIQSLYHQALKISAEERRAFLANACAGDHGVEREIEALLSAAEHDSAFVEELVGDAALQMVAVPQRPPFMIGTRLAHYEITAHLGSGGMGDVYQASDTKLNRKVAIKVLPTIFAHDTARMVRLQREAKVLAFLNHPNIAHIYGVEESALVMEFAEGEPPKGPMRLDDAWQIAMQIADALEYAHEQGVVHRDLKPANIKVGPDGAVKLLDFGLAKAFSDRLNTAGIDPSNSPTLTMARTVAGTIIGTAAYMSPEQAQGKRVDQRADIWSWGVVLYELLTGESPFNGDDIANTLAQVLTKTPDLHKVPIQVRKILERCLEKDPRQRLRHIGDIRFLFEDAEVAKVPSLVGRARKLLWPAIAGLCLLFAAGVALRDWRIGPKTAVPVERLTMEIAPAEMLGNGEPSNRPSRTAIAFSPDGSTVVFSGRRGVMTQLYKRTLSESEPVAISGTDGAIGPFFSPDGEWIGFWAGDKLKKVPVSGGSATVICDAPGSPSGTSWGPADNIVFVSAEDGALMRVSAAGGKPETLLKPVAAKGEEFTTPELLPDGRTLLFTLSPSYNWEEAEIVARRLDNGMQRMLIKGGADARYVPTGHLVYMRQGTLLAVPFNMKRLELSGPPSAMLDGVMQAVNEPNRGYETGMGQFSISTSGNLLYASGGIFPHAKETLVTVDRKGTQSRLNTPPGSYMSLRVSPDGRRLAVFETPLTNYLGDIWVVDINRGTSTRLTSQAVSPGAKEWPIWSPDGKQILFAGGPGNSQILSIRADGSGGIEPVMTKGGYTVPGSWSADGKWLAYLQSPDGDSGATQIWTRPMSIQGEPRKFLASEFNYTHPALSPTGRSIAYVSDESGSQEVYVQPFPGPGEKVRISEGGGTGPVWEPNGRELFYTAPGDYKSMRMMVVDIPAESSLDVGKPRVLFEGTWVAMNPVRAYDITPDGQHFIMTRYEELPDQRVTKLNVVLNWFRELEERVPAK